MTLSTETMPAQVVVHASGNLEEIIDRRGVRYLRRIPALLAYARALLATDRDHLRFVWIDIDKLWLSISVRVAHCGSERSAFLTILRSPPFRGLTLRELETLTLLAAGLNNGAIAARLEVAPRTITKHVENIFTKLEISTRAAATAVALDHGVLRLPTPGGLPLLPLTLGVVEQAAAQQRPPRHQSVDERPILIGMPLSWNVAVAANTRELLDGAALAMAEINHGGGLLGRKLKIHPIEYELGDDASLLGAQTRLLDLEADAIVTGYLSTSLDVVERVADYGAPYLHGVSRGPLVEVMRDNPDRFRNVFSTSLASDGWGAGLARTLLQLEERQAWSPSNRRLLMIPPSWRDATLGIPALEHGLAPYGWTVSIYQLPSVQVIWPEVIAHIHRVDPAVVFFANGLLEHAIAFQQAFRANPLDALICKFYAPSIPAYLERLGMLADGVLWMAPSGRYQDRIGRAFEQRFRARYRRAPGHSQASLAYDNVRILAHAWSLAGNVRRFDQVNAQIRASVIRGNNGAYDFSGAGQSVLGLATESRDPSVSVAPLNFQIQGRQHRVLYPRPYATGRFRLPPWFKQRANDYE